MDIAQVTPGHLLVVPNSHASDLSALPPDVGGEIFRVAVELSHALRRSTLLPEGINLHLADGEVAGQEIFHVHLHVLPRYTGDGFGIRSPNLGRSVSRAELDRRAIEVRTALRGG
jgi:diadenosine tetraphosphate (Ap4A) HIT family hydrolase